MTHKSATQDMVSMCPVPDKARPSKPSQNSRRHKVDEREMVELVRAREMY